MNRINQHTESIKAKALTMGFSHVGIAKAERLDEEGARLEEWLNRGNHADMAWLSRNVHRRVDPRETVPEARSVVVVTWNYFTKSEHLDHAEVGKISRYAWGDDYHDIVTPRVRELGQFIDSLEDSAASRSYVDTGPVMEKAWAARAGIGWIGKHTNLISRDYGSWLFLGVIITTLELKPDQPVLDLCGTCTACLDACPTNAIYEPYIVDSNKCIPYLTIECKGDEDPATHTMDFENWVFGCDICQDVCPWNRFQKQTDDQRFEPRTFTKQPYLADILDMTEDDFRTTFRKSPVKRTKLAGLQRNARIVIRQNESNSG